MNRPLEPSGFGPREGERTAEEKETVRLEAFSDGVFAVAITLLVLDIKVPKPGELGPGGLLAALVLQWPVFLAYLTSFSTILVMWINHHTMFNQIERTSRRFLFLNGFLLLFVTLVPFPTSLLAEYIERPEAPVAAAIYAGTFFWIAICFNLLWRHASADGRLLGRSASPAVVREISREYRFGPLLYLLAFGLAFLSVPLSTGLCLVLAVYFSFAGRGRDREGSRLR